MYAVTTLRTMSLPHYLEGGGSANLGVTALLIGEVVPPKEFEDIGLLNPSLDVFVVVDLIGVNLDGVHYYTRGKMLAVIQRQAYEQLKATGKPRNLILLRGGSVRLQRGQTLGADFVVMAAWRKGAYGQWKVSAVSLRNPGRNAFPAFLEVAMTTARKNWEVTFPVSVPNSYRYACPDYEFQLVDPFGKQETVAPDANPNTASAMTGVAPSTWGSAEGYKELPAHQQPGRPLSPELFQGAPKTLGISSTDVAKQEAQANLHSRLSKERSGKSKLENRFELAPKPESVQIVEQVLEDSQSRVAAILAELKRMSDSTDAEVEEGDEQQESSAGVSGLLLLEDEFDELSDDLKQSHRANTKLGYTRDALRSSWTKSKGYLTGRALFKEALEYVLEDFAAPSSKGISPIDEYLTALGATILDYWYDGGINLDSAKRLDKEEDKFIEALVENRMKIYFRMLTLLLSIRFDLSETYEACAETALDFFAILEKNPYYLCFIDPRLRIEDLDKLASFSGLNIFDPEIMRIRNVAYMHNLMLDSSSFVRENTIVDYDKALRYARSGFILTQNHYQTLQQEGFYIKKERLISLHYFINPNLKSETFRLPTTGWKQLSQKSGKMLLPLQGVNSLSMVKDYVDSGLGLKFEIGNRTYLADYIFAHKEMYIYNRLRELCTYNPKKLREEDIEEVIRSFEAMKHRELGLPPDTPYKLEERQADAVRILGTGNRVICLTGPAGSGKTTTAEALIYGVEMLLDKSPNTIFFCAPTGKAANRLKEVVKRKTRTINSLFRVGGDNVYLSDPDKIKNLAPDDIEVLVMDESSMPNINLMYEVIIRIKKGTYVFFLGDKEQLTPIGFGKPFATMLNFLPTVALNVTKRASEKSGTTRNCNLIINHSDDSVMPDLVDTPDFRIIDTKSEQESVALIKAIVDYHLHGKQSTKFVPATNVLSDGTNTLAPRMNPDDVQVITPINGKEWGTINLNKLLQDSFNPRDPNRESVFFPRSDKDVVEFRIGDRVMHVNSNDNEKARFLPNGDGTFTVWADERDRAVKGIANGEVGKVVAFIPGKELKINYGSLRQEDVDKFKRKYTNSPTMYYVAVKFSDIDVETSEMVEFICLYRGELTYEKGKDLYLSGLSPDLRDLDLSYACTVHKMQGSQAKLCICVFHEIRGDFITRNMVYTAASRAREGNYMIGSIRGAASAVNIARRIEQSSVREALVDIFHRAG